MKRDELMEALAAFYRHTIPPEDLHGRIVDFITRLRAENARLREALELLVEEGAHPCTMNGWESGVVSTPEFKAALGFAREALEASDG